MAFAPAVRTPTMTTMHGRLDIEELHEVYRGFASHPVVSISDTQRGPMPWMNWATTIYHGVPADLLKFNPNKERLHGAKPNADDDPRSIKHAPHDRRIHDSCPISVSPATSSQSGKREARQCWGWGSRPASLGSAGTPLGGA